MSQKRFNTELLDFLERSPTAFHAVAALKSMLLDAGFIALSEEEQWHLVDGHEAAERDVDVEVPQVVLHRAPHGQLLLGRHAAQLGRGDLLAAGEVLTRQRLLGGWKGDLSGMRVAFDGRRINNNKIQYHIIE